MLVNSGLVQLFGKKRRTEERFQYCLKPNSSEHFLAIQGHSGGTLVDPTLQDNVLLPNDFAEYIYHVGNAHDMHSIIQGGLILGGRSLKRDWQSVFLHSREPNVRQARSGRSSTRPGQTQNYGVQKILGEFTKKTVYWCNLKLAQRRGLQFYQTSFQHTTCDWC